MKTEMDSGDLWTSARRYELVLQILMGEISVQNATDQYGLSESEVNTWTKRFLSGARIALMSDEEAPKMVLEMIEIEVKAEGPPKNDEALLLDLKLTGHHRHVFARENEVVRYNAEILKEDYDETVFKESFERYEYTFEVVKVDLKYYLLPHLELLIKYLMRHARWT